VNKEKILLYVVTKDGKPSSTTIAKVLFNTSSHIYAPNQKRLAVVVLVK